MWKQTDFFEKYNKYETDLIFSVCSGGPEFPVIHLNKPLIQWNVFGSADTESENLVYSVGVSPWVQKEYIENGGNKNKSGYCFLGLEKPKNKENLRKVLGIDEKELVIGFHQRDDINIFSDHALIAWENAINNTSKKIHFLVLGGCEKYKTLAKKLDLNVHFLPVTFNYSEVSKFLRTLDIFSHSAGAGESLGIAVQEAMIHGLPIVSMYGQNNGHVDVIGDTIKIAKNQEEYNNILSNLINDDLKRKSISLMSYKRAENMFSLDSMKKYFENLFIKEYSKYKDSSFKIKDLSIYKKNSFRVYVYRLLSYLPILMYITIYIYKKIKKNEFFKKKKDRNLGYR